MIIADHKQLRKVMDKFFGSNREFIMAFHDAGGKIDETVLSRQLSGSRGLSSAWLSAYNIFFYALLKDVIWEEMDSNMWDYILDNDEASVFFSSDHPEACRWIETEFPGRWNGQAYFIQF